MIAAALLALALLPAAPSRAQLGAPPPVGQPSGRPFGLLLLGRGDGPAWDQTLAQVRKLAAGRYPVVFAAGEADAQAVQQAVDALEALKVEKIVAVPLFVSSYSDIMDENRYLFGIRERPSPSVVGAAPGMSVPRLKSRVPLVLTRALDDQPAVVAVVADRARALTRAPEKSTLVLVGAAPADRQAAADWVSAVSSLAQKARLSAGFARGQAMALREEQSPDERQRSEGEVRDAIRALRKDGPVAVVPLELSDDYVSSRLKRMLESMFVRYDGKTLLPDERLARWACQSAEAAAKLPDMRQFKDNAGRAGPLSGEPQLGGPPKLPPLPPIHTAKPPKENAQ